MIPPRVTREPHGGAKRFRKHRHRFWPVAEHLEQRQLLSLAEISTPTPLAAAWLRARGPRQGTPTGPSAEAFQVPGEADSTTTLTFLLAERDSAYRNEVGLFLVDDASGRIGRLRPGSPNYARAALARRIVLFTPGQKAGASTDVSLPGGSHFGTYLVANSSSERWLARKGARGHVYFSFQKANANRYAHVRATTPNTLGFEDLWRGGDRDHNDAVIRVKAAAVDPVATPAVVLARPTPGLLTNRDVTVEGAGSDPLGRLDHVTLRLDSGPGRPAPLDASGRFSMPLGLRLDGSADGLHTVTAVATNRDGLTSPPASVTFTLDTRPPTQTVDGPAEAAPTNRNIAITGQVADSLSGVATLEARIDGGAYQSVAFDAAGAFSFATGLPLDGSADGTHEASLRTADRAGNVSVPARHTFTLDTRPPTVTLTGPAAGLLTNANVTVTGRVADTLSGVGTLEARVDGGVYRSVAFDAGGGFTLPITLPLDQSADGPHEVTFRATDRAGNVSAPVSYAFTLDTTPPPVNLGLDPASDTATVGDDATSLGLVDLVGTTEPGLPVTLASTDATVTSDSLGMFRFTAVPLALAANPFEASARDAAGNIGRASRTIYRCGFPDDLAGWTASERGGAAPAVGSVAVVNSRAVLTEGNSFEVTLSRTFVIPENPTTVSFAYADLAFDTSSTGLIRDALEAALLGDNGRSIVPTFTAGRDAFFNVTEGLPAATGSGVTVAGQAVTLDISQAIPGTTATLVFRLVNNDADTTTTVAIVCASTPAATASASPPAGSAVRRGTVDVRPQTFAPRTALAGAGNATAARPPDPTAGFASASVPAGPPAQTANGDSLLGPDGSVAFTTSEDFLLGTLFNTDAEAIQDEVRLVPPGEAQTYPFIWISNSGESTVSRLDTRTGQEIGRYRTGGTGSNPSRIAVTGRGDAWVANRDGAGTVIKVLLDRFIDRNGNGVVDTCQDLNGDGRITGSEVLPWDANGDGQPDDERIALVLTVGGGPRGVAIDANDKLWVSPWSGGRQFYVYDSETGILETTVQTGYGSYGAVIDGKGHLWSVGGPGLVHIDTNTRTFVETVRLPAVYGLTVDRDGIVWVCAGTLSRYDPATRELLTYNVGYHGGGVTVDRQGNVWCGESGGNRIGKVVFESDRKTLKQIIPVTVGSAPKSASLDADGYIWTVCLGSNNAYKIDTTTNTVVPGWPVPVGASPYNYSDMTGAIRLGVTARNGHWSEIIDGEGLPWVGVEVDAETPEKTTKALRVRVSDSRNSLASVAWVDVPAGSPFPMIRGRYLEVQVALTSSDPASDPVLREVRVQAVPRPTVQVSSPPTGAQINADQTVVLTGQVNLGRPVLPDGTRARNSVVLVTVDGKPVEVLDPSGRFFTRVTVRPGQNTYTVEATDVYGLTATTTHTLQVVQRAPDAVDFSILSDITASFRAEYARTSFHRDEATLFADVAVRNVGRYPTDAPLYVAIDHLSDPTVIPLDAHGYTPSGLPYYDVSGLVPDGRLLAGQSTGNLPFAFWNPSGVRFTYDLVFFGLLNRAPEVTTVPVVEAATGRPYAYDVDASDPDGDAVTFALADAPIGMTIEAASGRISWTPAEGDLGTHEVVVRADDGRGGWAEQRFTVSVIVPPPNRPPVITTLPEFKGYVGQPYVYDADAADVDGDTLTFSFGKLQGAPRTVSIANASFEDLVLEDGVHTPLIPGWTSTPSGAASTWNPGPTQFSTGIPHGENIAWMYAATISQTLTETLKSEARYSLKVDTGHRSVAPFGGYRIELLAGGVVLASTTSTSQPKDTWATASLDLFVAPDNPSVGQPIAIRMVSMGNEMCFDNVRLVEEVQRIEPAAPPQGMQINPSSGVISWTPTLDQIGKADVSILVTDSRGGTAAQNFSICVTPDPANQRPLIVSHPVAVCTLENLVAQTSGQFGPPLTPNGGYGILSANGGVNNRIYSGGSNNYVQFDGIGVLTEANGAVRLGEMTFQNGDVRGAFNGDFPLTVRLRVGDENPTEREFRFVFNWINTPNTGTPQQNADRLAFSNTGDATQTFEHGGIAYTLELIGFSKDGGNTLVSEFISLEGETAHATLYARLLAAPGSPGVDPPEVYEYPIGAVDGDGDALVYHLIEGPSGAMVDPQSGLLRWTLGLHQLGPQRFRVAVEDGRGGYDEQSFIVDVLQGSAAISGRLFGDAAQDALAGWTVYLDQNQNGRKDGNELSAITSAQGEYALPHLPPGDYLVALVPQSGWRQTFPSGSQAVSLAAGQTASGVDFEISPTVGSANHDPMLDALAIPSLPVHTLYQATSQASDPDNDPVTFDLPTAPAGMTVHPTLGVLVWTPTADQVGTHRVVLRVQDGRGGVALQSFELTVTAPNAAPVITSTPPGPATSTLPYVYAVRAQDAENETLAFTLDVGAPEGVDIDPETGRLTWTPTEQQVGTHSLRVLVTDAAGNVTAHAFSLAVVATSTNTAPTLTVEARSRAWHDRPYAALASATDPNGDPVKFRLGSAPDGMTIDGQTGVISWSPAVGQGGEHSVTVIASDGRAGGESSATFRVDVVSQDANAAPRVVAVPRLTALVGQPYASRAEAIDPDGDPVTWSLVTAPRGLSIDPATGELRWTPALDQLGAQTVVVRAQDALLQAGTLSFSIIVTCVNRSPELASRPPTEAWVAEAYVYAVRADDPEADPLRFTLLAYPPGMTINAATGLIRWTPTADQGGKRFTVAVQVEDGQGNLATQSFAVDVSATPRNSPPVITSRPRSQSAAGAGYSYAVTATDPEGTALRFELGTHPDGMLINETTGALSWTPGDQAIGSHIVTVRALDADGSVAQQSFLLEIKPELPPVIATTPGTEWVTAGNTYRLDVRATDPNGDPVTFRVVEGPPTMTVDALGRLRWLTRPLDVGMHPVRIVVTDAQGSASELTFNLEVRPDTEAPVVSVTATPALAAVGQTVTFRVVAGDNVRVESLQLFLDGQPLVLNADGTATRVMDRAGTFAVTAAAFDPSGLKGERSTTLRVGDPSNPDAPVPGTPGLPPHPGTTDPSDTNRPVVVITSPTFDTRVTTTTPVLGTVDDPEDNLWFWRVFYASVDTVDLGNLSVADPDWVRIGEGTTEVSNGRLAVFDPTLLARGPYAIALAAYDVNGRGYVTVVTVGVEGNLVLGNFRLEFTDLQIPLAGIPITVTRVYDTLQAGREGDFGHGWTLGVQDAHILETVPAGSAYVPNKTRVFLTAPDGRRIGFTYTPRVSNSWFGTIAEPRFTADPGVTETLEVLDKQVGTTGVVGGLSGPYNPDVFILTTKDGTKYEYDQAEGLKKITDLNGNVVSFREDGIFHSGGPSIRFDRDHRGRITRITDLAGNTLDYRYDAKGDLVAFDDQDKATAPVRYTYLATPAHFLDTITDAEGRKVFDAEFGPDGRLTASTDGTGARLAQDFDLGSRSGTVRDGNGNTTELLYNDRGNILVETLKDPSGKVARVRRYEYNDPRNPDKETRVYDPRHTDAAPVFTEYEYDAGGNLTRKVDPYGTVTTYNHNARGNVTRENVRSADATIDRTRTFVYNDTGLIAAYVDGAGNRRGLAYDPKGRLTAMTDAEGNTTRFQYAEDRPVQSPEMIIYPGGASRTLSYTAFGRINTIVDEEQHKTTYNYDRRGLLTSIYSDAAGHFIAEFGYDAAGNRTLVRDPLGNETRFVYDTNRKLREEIITIDGRELKRVYNYDANGNLKYAKDRNDRVRTMEYDAANNLVLERWYEKDGSLVRTIRSEYDPAGNRTVATTHDSTIIRRFDSLNRMTFESNEGTPDVPLFTLTYTLDASGNPLSVVDNSGVRQDSVYDARDLLTRRTWQGPGLTGALVTFDYDRDGRRTRIDRHSGLVETSSAVRTATAYTARGQIDTITHTRMNGAAVDALLDDYDYDYNARGLVESLHRNTQRVFYGYDVLGQLIDVDYADNAVQADERYRYDANGNRTSSHLNQYIYRIGSDNRLLTDGESSYQYDAEGNLVLEIDVRTGARTRYEYDFYNRLVKADPEEVPDADPRSFKARYDAAGRRVLVSHGGNHVSYQYLGANDWRSSDAEGSAASLTLSTDSTDDLLGRLAAGGSAQWYLANNIKSVEAVLDGSSGQLARYALDSFGRILGAEGGSVDPTVPGLASRPVDRSTGLYFNRSRYLDARLGRFISQDPTGFESGDWNTYKYGLNNPTKYSDPQGTTALVDTAVILGSQMSELAAAINGFFGGFAATNLIFLGQFLKSHSDTGDAVGNIGSVIAATQNEVDRIKKGLGYVNDRVPKPAATLADAYVNGVTYTIGGVANLTDSVQLKAEAKFSYGGFGRGVDFAMLRLRRMFGFE